MTMKKLKWLAKAAVVGYLDVVLALLEIIGIIVSGGAIAVAAHKIQASIKQPAEALLAEREEPVSKNVSDYDPIPSPVRGYFMVPLTLIWVSVGVAAFLAALQLVAAVRMLKATEMTYDRVKAIGPTRCWLHINCILIFVSAPFYIFIWGPIGSAGYFSGLIIRLIMYYVVSNLLQELMATTNRNNFKRKGPGPT